MPRNLTEPAKKLLIDMVEADRKVQAKGETFGLVINNGKSNERPEVFLTHSGLTSEQGEGIMPVRRRDLAALEGYISFDHEVKGYRITSLGYGFYEYIK